jgi:tubulin epsilon
MRFPGALNMDLNEITSTLVPFPKLHFLSTACVAHSVSLSRAHALEGRTKYNLACTRR